MKVDGATSASFTIDYRDHHRRVARMTMPEALDFAGETWADNPALTFLEGGGPDRTWAQLREDVTRVRSGLQAAGVRHGDRVGVLLDNQLEFPVSWFAIAELGAVIVPMNPKYTRREIEFVMGDAGVTWLIADATMLDSLSVDGALGGVAQARVVVVGDETDEGDRGWLRFVDLLGHEELPRTQVPGVDDLANIQFTSGTTGLPKGCMLTHRYWIAGGVQSAALFDDPQRILADHPFYYLQNQAYFTMALAGGGALHVTRGLSRRKFMGWLVDQRIDFAWIDDGMLDVPRSELDRQLVLKKAPVAALPAELHAELESRFDLVARDWYASTEVGSGTFVPFDRTDLVGSGSMGLVFPNRESKIVDAQLEEVEAGVVGELCLRGDGMMQGYYNRPETNAELFLPGGWFRTGDLVRKNADGLHYYQGRLRDVIRRSGESIASAEVEQQILTMPEVAEVGVVPVPDRERGEDVKAIVVLKPGESATAEQVVDGALKGLSSFKIPRYVEFRAELPMTSSGKVRKAALREEDPFNDSVIDVTGPNKNEYVKTAAERTGHVE